MFPKNSLYDFKEKIGHGSFGEVWLVKNVNTGKKCVLKKLKLSSITQVEKHRAILEAQLLATLQHPNIVTYHDSFFQPHNAAPKVGKKKESILNIVMCFCEGGDLFEYIQKRNGQLIDEAQIVEWLIQLCMALKYLNDKRILHRDLKTRNIFLTRKGLIKLGDFGIARVLDGTLDMAATQIGTPYYMSPEILTGKPYNHKSDIWSLGCCTYEMASLKHAFRARNFNNLLFKVLHCKPPEIPHCYSQELSGLISSMLNSVPEQRPSAESLLEHPFIHKHIFRFLENTKRRKSTVCDNMESNSVQDWCQENLNLYPVLETDLKDLCVAAEPNSNVIQTYSETEESVFVDSGDDESRSVLKCDGRTFSVEKLCEVVQNEKPVFEQQPGSSGENQAVLFPSPNCDQRKDNILCNQQCSIKNTKLDPVTLKTGRKEIFEQIRCQPSEARARRRLLQKCVSLNNCHTKDVDQGVTNDCQIQRHNASARQRRRDRLSQEADSSREEDGKLRPKSAPSRFTKITQQKFNLEF